MHRLADFKGIHYGEALVVCGLGHSISTFHDPERFRTVGVNDIGRAFTPTYLFCMDSPSSFPPERFRFIRDSRARYVFADHDLGLRRENVVRFPIRKSEAPLLDDPDALYYIGSPPTSPFVALCLAAHMGAKAIGLVGVDFTNGHFFAADGPHRLQPGLAGINQRFYRLGRALLDRGVKVFNLSAESRLSAFPRLSPDAFFDLQESGRTRAWSRPVRRTCLVSAAEPSAGAVALARFVNTHTTEWCRVVAPGSGDVEPGATPEVEGLLLADPGRQVDARAVQVPPGARVPDALAAAWARTLRSELPEERRRTAGQGRPSYTAIVCQGDAGSADLAAAVRGLWPELGAPDELAVIPQRGAALPRWLGASGRVAVFEPGPHESLVAVRNRVASQASGDLLLFCESDTQPEPGWALRMAAAFRDRRVAAAGPAIVDMYGPRSKGFGMRWADAELSTAWLPRLGDAPYPVPFLSGAFLAVRRKTFLAHGGFDPGMPRGGGEDVELCCRLWAGGGRCVVIPELEAAWLNRFREGLVRTEHYWSDLLHNLLRIAAVHLTGRRLEALIARRHADPAFPRACARLLGGELAARRAELGRPHPAREAWFFGEATT